MQQISVSGAKAKGLLTTSCGGNAVCLKCRHILFEVSGARGAHIIICTLQPDTPECQKIEEDSSDTASESDADGE